MTATTEQLTEWMAETGHGYKAAAKHFGLPVADVRDRCKPLRNVKPPTRAQAREVVAVQVEDEEEPAEDVDWSKLPPREHWARELNWQMGMARTARGVAAKDHSRLAMYARENLDAIQEANPVVLSIGEQIVALVQDSAGWPDQAFEALFIEYARRHRGSVIFERENGTRALLTGDRWVDSVD